MTLPKLTPSQWRSLATGTLAIAITVNSAWLQLSGTPGIHIPLLVTALMQGIGILVAMGSRSLNKKDSGTGTGVVGDPACPVTVVPLGPAPPAVLTAPVPAANLMTSLITALAPVGQMLLTAYAADLVARQHQQAATDATVQIDQSVLLAAHAKIDNAKINAVAPLAVPDAQTPALSVEPPTEAAPAAPAGYAEPDTALTLVTGGAL